LIISEPSQKNQNHHPSIAEEIIGSGEVLDHDAEGAAFDIRKTLGRVRWIII
jgi:hypothetical protein